MMSQELKDAVVAPILANIRTPGQCVGVELNAQQHRQGSPDRVSVCHAFRDTYALVAVLAGAPSFSRVSWERIQARRFKITDSPLWIPFLISTK
jgi:hypothetical protein